MKVRCNSCASEQEIADPAPEGWQYNWDAVNYRFNDDGTQVVDSRSGTRSVFWKCAANIPTKDNPNALCGTDNEIVEDWSEGGSTTNVGGTE